MTVGDPMIDAQPRRRRRAIPVAIAAIVLLAGAGSWHAVDRNQHHPASSQQAVMAGRAQQVMPFDLGRTTHTFTKTTDGGIQQVVVDDPADHENLVLIRSHLRMEAAQFRTGNYADPARIHGMDMPGVAELQAGATHVKVEFAEIPNGAQIAYSATTPELISALHAWFDRQVTDHAMPGMGG
jgi:hypothetical protein